MDIPVRRTILLNGHLKSIVVDPPSSLTLYKADTSLRSALIGMYVPTASVLETVDCNICNVVF